VLTNRDGAYRQKGRWTALCRTTTARSKSIFGRALTFQEKASYNFDTFLHKKDRGTEFIFDDQGVWKIDGHRP
jgi:hypothetical protein